MTDLSALRLTDPSERGVLEDRALENGGHLRWLAWPLIADADAAVATADTAADAAAADADAAADAATAADAAADAATADDAADAADDADDAADAAADDADRIPSRVITAALKEEPDMREGLKLIQIPGRYGWAVTLVGWLRRVQGDNYEMVEPRLVLRVGQMRGLSWLAMRGPGEDYEVREAEKGDVEEVTRLLIRRAKPCNEEAWAKLCPKPEGWKDNGS